RQPAPRARSCRQSTARIRAARTPGRKVRARERSRGSRAHRRRRRPYGHFVHARGRADRHDRLDPQSAQAHPRAAPVTRPQRRALVGVLLVLAAAALSIGITATVAPRGFYRGFPFFRHWVDLLPPYNEHLTTDVGELQLAFGILFLWAARRPEPALVVPLCLCWMISTALHLTFHVLNLEHFDTLDAVMQ